MSNDPQTLEGGAYEIIRNRLLKQGETLRERLAALNEVRRDVFGSLGYALKGAESIATANNCVPRDMVALGDTVLFGYNVRFGLRTDIGLADVFSLYTYTDGHFRAQEIESLKQERFLEDFRNLYRYYRETVFMRFVHQGSHLYMLFRTGNANTDLKVFKWLIHPDHQLEYLDDRSGHEIQTPEQHAFRWTRAHRDMHREGKHPHVSILDQVFVETVNGDLTIKVEDNTDTGRGIYAEEVDHRDQTLDDAEYFFADLGNIILLKIRPFQEKKYRFLAFNEKMQEVRNIPTLEDSCVRLPDGQGIIFSNGYYLQTGEYKLFDTRLKDMRFDRRISSPNGEDHLYVFYNEEDGLYTLLSYNLISQTVETPIHCHGYCMFGDGEMAYFRSDPEPKKIHAVQIWQTPYTDADHAATGKSDNYLFKIGNKEIVRAMADCQEVLTLISKEDSYEGLYHDLVRKTGDTLDAYFFLSREEAFKLNEPMQEIRSSAQAAIDEFDKVVRIRRHTAEETERVVTEAENLLREINRTIFEEIGQFVQALAGLRKLRGQTASLRDLRYVQLEQVDSLDERLAETGEKLSLRTVEFLLKEDSLEPYRKRLEELRAQNDKVSKAAEASELEAGYDALGGDLELLIEIVSNLRIDDATQTTRIIDAISEIYAGLNQARAALRQRKKSMMSAEAVSEFAAQVKLINQAVANYLDVADSPEKAEDYLTRLMVQVEELEGKFAEFDEFLTELTGLREEIYNAFEGRKVQLIEARNRRADALYQSALRILKGIENRLAGFKSADEINAYMASDIMADKARGLVSDLREMGDAVKSEDLQGRLKTAVEDALRQLRDRQDLYVGDGETIKFGPHQFSVNRQALDLTIVPRDGELFLHLTGSDFFERIRDEEILATRKVWPQELISENPQVYRAEFLAYQLFSEMLEKGGMEALRIWEERTEAERLDELRQYMAPRYHEGYAKGVHDADARLILDALIRLHLHVDLLRYLPEERAAARLWWEAFLPPVEREHLQKRLRGAGAVLRAFPDSREFQGLIDEIERQLKAWCEQFQLFDASSARRAAEYLFHELSADHAFILSPEAAALRGDFLADLKQRKLTTVFRDSLKELKDEPVASYHLASDWIRAFADENERDGIADFGEEAAVALYLGEKDERTVQVRSRETLSGLSGDHGILQQGSMELEYNHFMHKMRQYHREVVPLYVRFQERKKQLVEEAREALRLDEFRPRVLGSFVRNKLIDEVYLPLIGDNLAKQIGVAGDQKRADRQGLLLLISPPGYGKTTLMEYIASRLGLIFMKINGPAIGHRVTSLDPAEATNSAAREELSRLNLAFEMGDNVMIYLDDIQHLDPEFLQKFISLCDGQRKIEGVYKGRPRTYDLRGKRVCVVMAGNPYTESGEKFRIPDMLANRADTYNLGDIIGDTARQFRLSMIENCLTANPVLSRVAQRSHKDIHAFLEMAEHGRREGLDFEGNYTPEEMSEIESVLQKLLRVRDVVLRVNEAYIHSAAQQNEYRTEPPFKLQGSYRDMNKIASRILPMMNEEEVKALLMSHYESEAQTLTSGAEANLLKFRELMGWMDETEAARWEEIKTGFRKRQRLMGLDEGDRMTQVIAQLDAFADGLKGIEAALRKAGSGKK